MIRLFVRLGKVLVWLACAAAALPSVANAQVTPTWTPRASLPFPRYHHSATELCNGKVLVVGSAHQQEPNQGKNAFLYDPATNQWRTIPMNYRHGFHTATLVPAGCERRADGSRVGCQVLIAGGVYAPVTNLSETFDEDTETFEPTKQPMHWSRERHTATPIEDGCRVLVAGGRYGDDLQRKTTEIYDASTRTWSDGQPMKYERFMHVAGKLPGGWVVVAGGQGEPHTYDTAEAWNPATGAWTLTSPPNEPRWMHSGCGLNDGRFFMAGGQYLGTFYRATEIYDLDHNAWTVAADMSAQRSKFTCTTLPDGRVVVAGGLSPDSTPSVTPKSEVFLRTGAWSPLANMNEGRYAHAAAALTTACRGGCEGCEVFVTGGYDMSVPKRTTEKIKP